MSMAAEIDRSVLLVDADVVQPNLLRRLGVPPMPGLLDLLADPTLELSQVVAATNVPKLSILSAGTPNAMSTELLASEAMERLLASMAEDHPDRVVIFDAPPLLLTSEAQVLASRVGQVVMVVEAGRTPRQALAQAFAQLEACPVVMPLLNKAAALGVAAGIWLRPRSGTGSTAAGGLKDRGEQHAHRGDAVGAAALGGRPLPLGRGRGGRLRRRLRRRSVRAAARAAVAQPASGAQMTPRRRRQGRARRENAPPQRRKARTYDAKGVTALSVAPSGNAVAVATADGKLSVVDPEQQSGDAGAEELRAARPPRAWCSAATARTS